MINQEYVYHSSKIRGLKILEPRPSTHKIPWVYATKEITTSVMHIGDNFDFICKTGISEENGKPYIWETFAGAFDLGYKNKKGSIYLLKPDSFKEGMTSYPPEIVSEVAVQVEKEILVDDVQAYLIDLEKQGKLAIYIFPNNPIGEPYNKDDIVQKGIDWTIGFGENTLDNVAKYHPDVLDTVIKGLKEKGYVFKGEKWAEFNKS